MQVGLNPASLFENKCHFDTNVNICAEAYKMGNIMTFSSFGNGITIWPHSQVCVCGGGGGVVGGSVLWF